jgi:hypothetical protein
MKKARLANNLDVTAIGLGSAPLGGLFSAVSGAFRALVDARSPLPGGA